MPRKRPNTRVKDLPDLALLASARDIDAAALRRALALTFDFRGTHALPATLPPPPAAWEPVYAEMAAEDELRWVTLADVAAAARAFLDPVLGDGVLTRWEGARWRWR